MSRKRHIGYFLYRIQGSGSKYIRKTSIKVVVKEDTEVLDEVVVVGYGAQKKASLTSSISQIKGMRLLKIRVLLMLQSLCKVKFRD